MVDDDRYGAYGYHGAQGHWLELPLSRHSMKRHDSVICLHSIW